MKFIFLPSQRLIGIFVFDLNTIVKQYKKRKRDRTFSSIERSHLVNLVEQHFAVIECKKYDALSCRAKSAEWDKITDEFNATTPRYISRDKTTLKNCWENLKKRARGLFNDSRCNTETGSSMEKELKEDPLMVKVLSLIKTKYEGFLTVHDFDAPMLEIVSLTNENLEESAEDVEYDFEATQDFNGDWSYCTPVHLMTPESQTSTEKCSEKAEKGNSNDEDRQPLEQAKNEQIKWKSNELSPSCVKTLNRPLTSMKYGASHSRPTLKRKREAALAENRINTLKISFNQTKEKHELSMKILLLQEQQEIEKLKQEKEKTQQEKIKTLKIINDQKQENHELHRKVLLLQEQQDAERLKYDKEKTERDKIKTSMITNDKTIGKHELPLKILILQDKQETEKLRQENEKTEQEKIKTEILRLELENKKQHSFQT